VTKLVRRVGTDGELHETPLMTTYHRRPQENIPVATTAQTPSVTRLFEDDGYPSRLFFFLHAPH
jgi:hypothetical protein